MATHRCVCSICTGYIRSRVIRTRDEQEQWAQECKAFHEEHRCDDAMVDGVEDRRRFEAANPA